MEVDDEPCVHGDMDGNDGKQGLKMGGGVRSEFSEVPKGVSTGMHVEHSTKK